MEKIKRGDLLFYIEGNFVQRIKEAQTPEQLDSIYNELNDAWKKEKVSISQDILDLFAYNKNISKDLFKKVMGDFGLYRLEFFKEIYPDLKEYKFIKFEDFIYWFAWGDHEVFSNYAIEKNINISDAFLLATKVFKQTEYSNEQITYFWGRRNEIEDNEQKKLFVKKLLRQRNVSKEILFQAFDEFKDDIDIVVEFFVNGIEYPEIFSKVLEKFDKDTILEKIKSNLNSSNQKFSYGYLEDAHILMSVARIADDNTLRRILNIIKKNDYRFPNKEIFNSQSEQDILEEPSILDDRTHTETFIKIMLCMAENPNVSLDTLKYIVQSTNDIEVLYYCLVNSYGFHKIYELIDKKKLPPVQEDLKNNDLFEKFSNEMKELTIFYYLMCTPLTRLIHHWPDIYKNMELFRIEIKDTNEIDKYRVEIYCGIKVILDPHYKENSGIVMDKIREIIKTISFEGISSDAYRPDDFPDLQSKEKAYFECLLNYELVNKDDVRKFILTCLGEEYLRRLERDIALFEEIGLDLSKTSKGTQQRGF